MRTLTQPMLLVDASIYIFRAYHALPDSLRGRDDRPLNVVYGFADFLCKLLAESPHAQVALAFDESLESSFRNELYPDYKANRESAPADLKIQIADCQAIGKTLGLAVLVSDRYEADDIIGTLAAGAAGPVTIVSSDKDLAQLLRAQDVLWDYARNLRYDPAGIHAKFGVHCTQLVDYLALMGDSVDNIPGVPGIGAKTAAALLAARPSLEAIYTDLAAIKSLPLRGAARIAAKLEAGRDSAFLSRKLARIVTDVPLPAGAHELTRQPANGQKIASICADLGIGEGLSRRLAELAQ